MHQINTLIRLNKAKMQARKKFRKTIISTICLVTIAAQMPISTAWAAPYNTTEVTYPYYAFVEDSEHPWSTVWDALDSVDTIGYSDDFFNEKSPGDHPELRAASYALALAGFENAEDGYPADDDLPPFSKLTDLLNQMGFSDYQYWDTSSEENGQSMGTTIGQKTLPSGEKLLVIAPRNYNYMTEWLSNFDVGTSGNHNGFDKSANLIVEHFNDYLSTHDIDSYKLWVVGYSRGGAVIDLFAKKINSNLSSYNLSSDDFYVYTFGAPRASLTETNYSNIHDVKDGNDLLLGYVFPKIWGFYNTGTYEEIHPADLEISTSVVNISDLADSERAFNILANNDGVTKEIDKMNGRNFMDEWIQFVTDNGLTREYFDTVVKSPLSAIMKAYQQRNLDEQSDFTNFFKDTEKGLAAMVAGNAFTDLMENYNFDLSSFPAYLDLVEIIKGTASEDDINEFITILEGYMGEYDEYEAKLGEAPAITEPEFEILKENLPKLIKALAPIIVADAKYTQETFGEDYSLYYTYSLISNAENLVIGHIPESIMPILKSLLPEEEHNNNPDESDNGLTPNPKIPNTGTETEINNKEILETNTPIIAISIISGIIITSFFIRKTIKQKNRISMSKEQ